MVDVRKKIRVKFISDKEVHILFKWQSKLDFDDVKPYDGFNVYIFENKNVRFDKPVFLGPTSLELSKKFRYETYYATLQSFFSKEKYIYVIWICLICTEYNSGWSWSLRRFD